MSLSGKILLFYLIFYAALVGFFAAMLAVFYQTLDDTKPKWQMDNSLIGSNPGECSWMREPRVTPNRCRTGIQADASRLQRREYLDLVRHQRAQEQDDLDGEPGRVLRT